MMTSDLVTVEIEICAHTTCPHCDEYFDLLDTGDVEDDQYFRVKLFGDDVEDLIGDRRLCPSCGRNLQVSEVDYI